MSSFATPQWETTDFGDEMCSKLFQGNRKNSANKKDGHIKKAKKKLKQLNSRINPEFLQKIGKQMTEVKNKINGKLSKDSETMGLNSSSTNSPREKKKKPRKKLKINGELIENLGKKMKNLTTKEKIEDPEVKGESKTSKKRKKKKTKDIKKLQNDINKNLNEISKKRKIKENIERLGVKIKDANLVNDVTEKYTKAAIHLKKINKKNEDSELLINNSPHKKNKKTLRERMLEQLKASRFRYLNEQIYTSESKNAQELFAEDPGAFDAYHEGYRQQVKRWPVNPLDVIIKDIKKMSKNYEIADLGCGDAKLALEVPQKVHSFDLVAANERVVACDMSCVPLPKNSVDIVVFCLSLMGTNLHDYLKEANRLLKVDGILKIAEVESRFDDVDTFIKGVQHFGFQNVHKNFSHNLFYFMDFKKVTNIKKTKGLPTLSLHPCLYKKR